MPSCNFPGCRHKHDPKTSNLSFHLFPKDETRRKQWLLIMKQYNWEPNPRSIICSAHFEETCIDRTGYKIRLKPDAVPSIFPIPIQNSDVIIWPNMNVETVYTQPVETEYTQPVETVHTQPVETVHTQPVEMVYIQPHSNYDNKILRYVTTGHTKLLESKIIDYKNKLQVKRKQVKVLQQKMRRKIKRIKNLENIITGLRQRCRINEKLNNQPILNHKCEYIQDFEREIDEQARQATSASVTVAVVKD